MLHGHGIDSVVLERQTKAYVLKRIRAGVLEFGSVQVLRESGAGERMDREGHAHDGSFIVWQDRDPFLIDTKMHTGKPMWSHGQTAITEELYEIRERDGGRIVEEAENVQLHDLTTSAPKVTYDKDGAAVTSNAISRRLRWVPRRVAPEHSSHAQNLPARLSVRLAQDHVGGAASRRRHLRRHERGFALFTAQSRAERYYIQCSLDTRIEDWPDDKFWTNWLAVSDDIGPGSPDPGVDRKSIAPLRGFVAEPMRMAGCFRRRRPRISCPNRSERPQSRSPAYSSRRAFAALFKARRPLSRDLFHGARARLGVERFSWWLTKLLHVFPDDDAETRVKLSEFDHLLRSNRGGIVAEQYAGLPFERMSAPSSGAKGLAASGPLDPGPIGRRMT